MRAWVLSAIARRDNEFLTSIGKLRGGKPKVSRGKKQPEDRHYLDWLMEQPCRICGRGNHEHIQVAACHVSRVGAGSGMGVKPLWNAIPGCHSCHTKQHQHGESVVGGRRQWDLWADEYLAMYVATVLLKNFGIDWEDKIMDELCIFHSDFNHQSIDI